MSSEGNEEILESKAEIVESRCIKGWFGWNRVEGKFRSKGY